MKKLLITGFEPFGGEDINPSWEAVSRLPETVGGYELTRLCLPVVFGEASRTALTVARELSPDVIICVGQAGGRDAVTPELVAINLRHASIPDNSGVTPCDLPVIEGGQNAYFSTLPVRKMAEAVAAAGIKAHISYSAGAYVCNDLLYTLLSTYEGSGIRVAFIHIPYIPEQGKQPSMPLDDIVSALTVAIGNMD